MFDDKEPSVQMQMRVLLAFALSALVLLLFAPKTPPKKPNQPPVQQQQALKETPIAPAQQAAATAPTAPTAPARNRRRHASRCRPSDVSAAATGKNRRTGMPAARKQSDSGRK